MKNQTRHSCSEIENLITGALTRNQRVKGLINEFYHTILTCMAERNISKSELARLLSVSPAAVSQMLTHQPNITLKKMVEIADAVGIELQLTVSHLDCGAADYED